MDRSSEKIKDLANKIRTTACGEESVSITEIIDSLGYQWLQFTPTISTAGIACALDCRRKQILTNAYDREDQRFYAAHAVGHLVLHGEESVVDMRIPDNGCDAREFEATLFARELIGFNALRHLNCT